jgi:hypothetical protein
LLTVLSDHVIMRAVRVKVVWFLPAEKAQLEHAA